MAQMYFKVLEAFPPALSGGGMTDYKPHTCRECLVQRTTLNLLRRQTCQKRFCFGIRAQTLTALIY